MSLTRPRSFHSTSLVAATCLLTALLAPLAAVAQVAAPTPPAGMSEKLSRGWTPEGLAPDVASRSPVECTLPAAGPVSDRSLWATNLWPGGLVYFEFDANVTPSNQAAMLLAMNEIHQVCNVTYVPRSGQANYLHIQDSTGNNSQIGMVGGSQTVNIFNWNFRFKMAHELIHALGVYHEQSRSDRGMFINVLTANIQASGLSQFDIVPSATGVGPFDFDSVMLYDKCGFSVCCPAGSTCNCGNSDTCIVMQALPAYASQQDLMGQRDHLSALDIAGLINRYGAPTAACCAANGTCTVTAQANCTGTWLVNLTCDTTPCTGACCTAAGACSLTTQTGCSGIFRGYGVACGASTCIGACCLRLGDCVVLSATSCTSNNGIFRGTDVPCTPSSCPGACCSISGVCTIETNTGCAGFGGIFRGTDVPCTVDTCPGACCRLGFCSVTNAPACTNSGGKFLGTDTTCSGMPCCCEPWDNYRPDDRGGQTSQIGVGEDWRGFVHAAFDDLWLCEGQIHHVDHISARLSTDAALPKFLVVLFPDCDGHPDLMNPVAVAGLQGTRFEVRQQDVPFILGRVEIFDNQFPGPDGFRAVDVNAVFDLKALAIRGGAYWVSFVGFSADLNPLDQYFWSTSGNRVVKGRPGIFYDGETFTDSDNLCCGCTDYNFCLEGEDCKILIDNGLPITEFGQIQFPGYASLQNGTRTSDRSRAADKFVFPPCTDFDPCYVEGWVWTNCNRVAIQFFDDSCRCPLDSFLGTPLREADCVMGTGITRLDPTGQTVELKKAQFFFPQEHMVAALLGKNRLDGFNIWLSLVALGDNRQNARGYFAIGGRCDRECENFGPACIRQAPFDITHWVSTTVDGTSVRGFDTAFLVAVREARFTRPVATATEPACRADINRVDGVTVQDLFDFLAAWFAGCP